MRTRLVSLRALFGGIILAACLLAAWWALDQHVWPPAALAARETGAPSGRQPARDTPGGPPQAQVGSWSDIPIGAVVVSSGQPQPATLPPRARPVGSQPPDVLAAAYRAPAELQRDATAARPAYVMYVPGGVARPRHALLALHGMGGSGVGMMNLLRRYADTYGWVVVAPTLAYGDWRDPNVLIDELGRLQPQLAQLLDMAPAETGVELTGRTLLFGFSRGAQAVLRFALLFPSRVQAVAALSAGVYTLPVRSVPSATGPPLGAPLPYGVADLEQRLGRALDERALGNVRFWIGVGERDNRETDVPRQWDPYVGKNRVERAQRFAGTLGQQGYQVQLTIVPGAGHELAPAMLDHAFRFFLQASENRSTATSELLPIRAR